VEEERARCSSIDEVNERRDDTVCIIQYKDSVARTMTGRGMLEVLEAGRRRYGILVSRSQLPVSSCIFIELFLGPTRSPEYVDR
jgi:hypothetical protein